MRDTVQVDFAALGAFFRADDNVVLAMVFGSAAGGTVAPGSDLDIAVLFRNPPAPGATYLDFYLRLCAAIPAVEDVDLVNLNRANTILAFEALRGRVIRKNDAERVAEYVSLVCREYEDVMGNLEHQRWLRTQAA
jgi:predicted nucleotidyltransferase